MKAVAVAENRLTKLVFLHILFSRNKKNAGNGKSTFLERCQRETADRLRAVFTGEKGSASGSRLAERGEKPQVGEPVGAR